MKKSIIIFFMMSSWMAFSQNYGMKWSEKDPPEFVYMDLSFDANMAFGFKDNKDTQRPDRGFDWDLEAGAVIPQFIGIYIYYGRFDSFKYQNYGFGLDYYLKLFRERNIETTIGIGKSWILRQDDSGGWGSVGGYVVRGKATWFFWNNIGVSGRLQYQQRKDIEKHGTIEGSIGLTFKIDN